MSYAINAIGRTKIGRQAKQELRESRLPAVIYGHGSAAQAISVPRSEFLKVFKSAGYSSLVDVAMDGGTAVKALIKDVQRDPVSYELVHIDFYQVRMDEKMTASIPLRFVGESMAVKSLGGTLLKSLDTVDIECLPANLPHDLEVDLSKLATFDDAISIKDISVPAGVEFKTEGDVVIATVARPLTEEEIKKMDESTTADLSTIKTEGEEKKAAEAAKKAAEEAAKDASK